MRLRTEDVFRAKGSSGMEESLGRRNVTSRRLDVTDTPNWTLRVVNFSEKSLDNLDTCHHPDGGQILITTRCLS